MIEKIVSIRNIGKFYNCNPIGDVALRKLTLVYAENALGKTTITSILRSLQAGDPVWIIERKTIGTLDAPFVNIRFSSQNAIFSNGAWDRNISDLEVFDSTFVERNVYSGSKIEIGQKRNLLEFVISQEAVTLAKESAQCDKDIDGFNAQLNIQNAKLSQHKIGDLAVDYFISLQPVENIQSLLDRAQKEVDSCKQAEPIQKKSALSLITYNFALIDELHAKFSSTLHDISRAAVNALDAHIKQCMDAKGELWIKQGAEYVKNNRCPYCGQQITDRTFVDTYADYFSAAYSTFVEGLDEFASQLRRIMADGELLKLQTSIELNSKDLQFWRKYIVAPSEPLYDLTRLKDAIVQLRSKLIPLLDLKLSRPLDVVDIDQVIIDGIDTLKDCVAELDSYDNSLRIYNGFIRERKEAVQNLDVTTAEVELKKLKNIQARYSAEVMNEAEEYIRLKKKKKETEDKKKKAKEALEKLLSNVLARLQEEINALLRDFGADFKIVELDSNYVGRIANAEYAIEILGQQVPVSDRGVPEPSFKNTLSAGDKTTLAFAFFLAKLNKDSSLAQKVVVIDDPISSLDVFRQTHTSHAISTLSARAEQVIVLSHYQPFLIQLYKLSHGITMKCLWIRRGTSSSEIDNWNVEEACESDYETNVRLLRSYVDHGHNGKLEDVARCIRPMLEGNLKLRFPGEINRGDTLGGILVKIRDCFASNKLSCFQGDPYQELSEINDYSNQFHHDTNPGGYGTAITTDSELRAYARRALDIIPGIVNATQVTIGS